MLPAQRAGCRADVHAPGVLLRCSYFDYFCLTLGDPGVSMLPAPLSSVRSRGRRIRGRAPVAGLLSMLPACVASVAFQEERRRRKKNKKKKEEEK